MERAEEKPLYTLKVSVLLMEMVKDKPKYREVVYRKTLRTGGTETFDESKRHPFS